MAAGAPDASPVAGQSEFRSSYGSPW
ncbi:hypothetical protein FRACA_340024 [Frankia canadensis]|uniref:Uncharacterized protein n=1 Tax=Frankia canadensis TaxID=1836972 RepID=A0A2I2KV27_9ACTN|nr:hypothetical protein FRACA_340024 [Frankia canadensis]SOU56804.1 hypothetical protein FRACA_340024 [Frankia canadensis]